MISREVLQGFQRLDSRSNPTVMARITLADSGRIIEVDAYSPSGASKGKREALELRDGEKAFRGKGVKQAVENVSKIADAISGLMVTDQRAIDTRMRELDGTDNKRNLGANAMVAVSLAVAKAGAAYEGKQLFQYIGDMTQTTPDMLPTPLMNVVNGGAHARNGLPFQEFMIVPIGAKNFAHAMRMSNEVYGVLGERLQAAGVGDEGGFAPTFKTSGVHNVFEVLNTLTNSICLAGYEPGKDIAIALDVAASEFFWEGRYHLGDGRVLGSRGMVEIYNELVAVEQFPIVSIEDGMAEGDVEGWKLLTEAQKGIQIVGDDLFVTNPDIFRRGINFGIANAILIKPNQIGTLSETLDVIRMARDNKYRTIISHRSGETEDTFIADLAVGVQASQIKTGAPARGERTAKYNRLWDIEEVRIPQLGLRPRYYGSIPFQR